MFKFIGNIFGGLGRIWVKERKIVEGIVQRCVIVPREGETGMFARFKFGEEEFIVPRLIGYTIIPNEEYDELAAVWRDRKKNNVVVLNKDVKNE